MEESADGAHGICPSTAEHHNTLLATPPKVDDHGTSPFHHPLFPTPSNCHDYCELLPPLKDGNASQDEYDQKSNS